MYDIQGELLQIEEPLTILRSDFFLYGGTTIIYIKL